MSDIATLQAIVVAVVEHLATAAPPAIPSREAATAIDDRAEAFCAVPQWTTADGQLRGVRIRALSFKQRMLADKAATRVGKDGATTLDAWRLLAEEVCAGIVEPRELTVDHILGWNDAVMEHIHASIQRLGPLPAALVARELARLAGGDPPPAPAQARGDGGDTAPDPLGE